MFGGARAERISALAQVTLGCWVVAGCLLSQWHGWYEYGYGAPKPALYGIWDVTAFELGGRALPPLTTDETRWRRIIFDVQATHYQRMDDTLRPVTADVDDTARTLVLRDPSATLTYERPAPDRLILRGTLGEQLVVVTLDRVDADTFPLRRNGFHWVQDEPSLS